MQPDLKTLWKNYDHYFTRKRNYRYWLVIVNNRFESIYSVFLYMQPVKKKLVRSYELIHFRNDQPALYQTMMANIREHSHLDIIYRDTRHLVHPGQDITVDQQHGHYHHSRMSNWQPSEISQHPND
ncbi:MAG: hypothetical protein ABF743_12430 [Schleiferilactobacillus perolens]|jgi:hypothetical protein|uniref:hypothetical protein n=1 Tax=Schleiferilactobacillus perolens TaxID=100468 RepID=UPI0039EB440C|nr:hypothetical protein [Schleiferilactobacillus harbinensis]MCI1913691.1 hypothetical protein [Schleiferilactobacillus harbinensis]